MQDHTDLYAELQVHHLAEPEVVDAAYRRLVRMYHPDVNKSPDANERMKRINLAYEVLSDPDKRAEYDRWRASRDYRQQPPPTPKPEPPRDSAAYDVNARDEDGSTLLHSAAYLGRIEAVQMTVHNRTHAKTKSVPRSTPTSNTSIIDLTTDSISHLYWLHPELDIYATAVFLNFLGQKFPDQRGAIIQVVFQDVH